MDRLSADEFLQLLFGAKPDDLCVCIWSLAKKASYWHSNLTAAAILAEEIDRSGSDVYLGVSLAEKGLPQEKRITSEQARGIGGFWVDLDMRTQAHKSKPLPDSVDAALGLLPADFVPTAVLHTGNGLHVWWAFKEPAIFETAADRIFAMTQSHRLQNLILRNSQQNGWAYDRLGDLARVMRIPGTHNHKSKPPKPVLALRWNPKSLYTLSDFEEMLDLYGVADPTQQHLDRHEMLSKVNVNRNGAGALTSEMLTAMVEADPVFRNTWDRRRDTLKDNSQSGYDLALANAGYAFGLNDQQVTDLIIAHRKRHNQKPIPSEHYLTRTLSTAHARQMTREKFETGEWTPDPVIFEDHTINPPEKIDPPADPDAPEDEKPKPAKLTREQLLTSISKALGMEITGIDRILGQEPRYHIHVYGRVIEIDHRVLTDQTAMRSFMYRHSNPPRYVKRMKPAAWDSLVAQMAAATKDIDGGDEAYRDTQSARLIDQYLTLTRFIQDPAEEGFLEQMHPMVAERQISITIQHFIEWHNRTLRAKPISSGEAIGMVKSAGGSTQTLSGKPGRIRGKFKDHSRWWLPPDRFPPEEYLRAHLGKQQAGGTEKRVN